MTKTNDPPLVASVALIPDSNEKADLDAPSDESGKLVVGQAPNITITSTTVVADQAERLSLEVQEGDIAIQQDTTESFIFTGGANELANWQLVQFDAVGGISGEDIAPRDIDGRNVTLNDLSVNGLLNGADTSGAAAGEALTSDGQGGFGFASVGGIEEVATFDDLPAIDPPQIAYVTNDADYYHSEPIIGTAFDIASATFSKSISSQDETPIGITLNADGTRLYEVGKGGTIYQSNLSTPFDIASATFSKSIPSQDDTPQGIAINTDGTRFYEIGEIGDKIYQSTLSTPFDIGTATFEKSIPSQDTGPGGIAFNRDGTRLYEVGGSFPGDIFQSNLSTAFDIGTATFEKSIPSQDSFPKGITINTDGTRLYVAGGDTDKIYQSTLSTPFDIGTATFSKSINGQEDGLSGLAFNTRGTRLYECGFLGNEIYQSQVATGGWVEF